MLFRVDRLFDSHVHWLATGEGGNGVPLQFLRSAEDVAHLQIRESHFRGEWLVGFGWDETQWPQQILPGKEILDRTFPGRAVFFSRVDGHCSWVSSRGLELLGLPPSHSGILLEQEHFAAFLRLPRWTPAQIRQALKSAAGVFNAQGFTHIRDMTCDFAQWTEARNLDLAGELSLYVYENFLCAKPEDLPKTLAEATTARAQETPHLKVQGIKIFYDGTLGSNTAFLSNCSCRSSVTGWSLEGIKTALAEIWKSGFEAAVHTIGDQAADDIVQCARQILATNQVNGRLNLEHVEVLQPETVQKMKALHIRCHMQPCHWLSDRRWLKEKLGPLAKNAFPWGALSRGGIPLSFGSDAPVAATSYADNVQALKDSEAEGIPSLRGEPWEFHRDPAAWGTDTYTLLSGTQVREVVFDGRTLFTAK